MNRARDLLIHAIAQATRRWRTQGRHRRPADRGRLTQALRLNTGRLR